MNSKSSLQRLIESRGICFHVLELRPTCMPRCIKPIFYDAGYVGHQVLLFIYIIVFFQLQNSAYIDTPLNKSIPLPHTIPVFWESIYRLVFFHVTAMPSTAISWWRSNRGGASQRVGWWDGLRYFEIKKKVLDTPSFHSVSGEKSRLELAQDCFCQK